MKKKYSNVLKQWIYWIYFSNIIWGWRRESVCFCTVPELKRIRQDLSTEELYLQACKLVGVVPVRYFLRNLGCATINLNHHGLGPLGGKALAIALVVRPTVPDVRLKLMCWWDLSLSVLTDRHAHHNTGVGRQLPVSRRGQISHGDAEGQFHHSEPCESVTSLLQYICPLEGSKMLTCDIWHLAGSLWQSPSVCWSRVCC